MKARKETPQGKHALTSWLNTIQQDSWQLKLVNSEIAIFLLRGAYEPLSSCTKRIAIAYTRRETQPSHL